MGVQDITAELYCKIRLSADCSCEAARVGRWGDALHLCMTTRARASDVHSYFDVLVRQIVQPHWVTASFRKKFLSLNLMSVRELSLRIFPIL